MRQQASLLALAQEYLKSGLSIIPIRADGSKAPALCQWKTYQSTQPQTAELSDWFAKQCVGIAVIAGAVSGGLEIIDFDDAQTITPWLTLVEESAPGLVERLPMVSTPTGGLHVYYRCEVIGWNTKLAERDIKVAEGTTGARFVDGHWIKIETLIETRGEGGYVLAPGSPAQCHPAQKPYDLIRGSLTDIPKLTPSERLVLLECAKALNERVKDAKVIAPERLGKKGDTTNALRPGDDFNQRGDLRGLLEKHGWSRNGKLSVGERWKRPGGSRASATLFNASGLLYVFSTNATPFECDRAYTPFAAYAALEHSNDYAAAARALNEQGYGEQKPKKAAPKVGEESAEEAEQEVLRRANPYQATEKGLIKWVPEKSSRGTSWVPVMLSNFTAEIVADLVEDDGVETRRSFEMVARMNNRESRFTVSAEDFGLMKWAIAKLGASAVIHPGKADNTRCAIQVLSESFVERHIYAHTGWRMIDGEMCFLHGGGAIGPHDVKRVEVRLPDRLQHAVMPDPPEGDELRDAIRLVLDLARLAPDEVMLPCIGSAFSSILGGAQFSIWLYGGTGSGKSQVAALVQSFFGRFTDKLLPGAWISTANSQETLAYAAKDMIFVMDDFKPVGSQQDKLRLYKEADRLLRAQGNQAGRQRMIDGSRLNQTKYPRGLIFNTAEEVPRYESLIARLLVIECNKHTIDFSQLTAFQKCAAYGVFASAMAGFLRWIAQRYDLVVTNQHKEQTRWRDFWSTRNIAQHRRFSTTLGHLTYSWSLWVEFAKQTGALNEFEAQELWERILGALTEAGRKQDQHTMSQNPVARFEELLLAGFASLRCHLESTEGGEPVDAGSWGWRWDGGRWLPGGTRVGWIDAKHLYLSPDAAYEFVNGFSASGGGVGLAQTALWKMMFDEKKILKKDEKRQTFAVRKKIGASTQQVLVLSLENLVCNTEKPDMPDIGDEDGLS